MAAACAFCSVAVVASFALFAVSLLSGTVGRGTVELRATTSYTVDCGRLRPAIISRKEQRRLPREGPPAARRPARRRRAAWSRLPPLPRHERVRPRRLPGLRSGERLPCLPRSGRREPHQQLPRREREREPPRRRLEGRQMLRGLRRRQHLVRARGRLPRGRLRRRRPGRRPQLPRHAAARRARAVHGASRSRDQGPRRSRGQARGRPGEEQGHPGEHGARVPGRGQGDRDRDRAAEAECARCLGAAARRVPTCSWGLDGWHVRVADVLGYGCFLRVETMVPPLPVETWLGESLDLVAVFVLLPFVIIAVPLAAGAAALEQNLIWGSSLLGCKMKQVFSKLSSACVQITEPRSAVQFSSTDGVTLSSSATELID